MNMDLTTYSFRNIVFLQGEEADEALQLYDRRGTSAAADYLQQWDNGDGDDITAPPYSPPWGTADRVHRLTGRHYLSVNLSLGYIGLCQRLQKVEVAR